ncbi:DNA-binding protein YbiB [Undibacterium cyanobacteriorum]|uniref:DNA-binding protein YbiB n=1 Tax=Undibacterium cyanobacteriorum TaxID=3073561 RepID=A0ABY9RF19_9BURK|nr:DNA-binding protein YbiB [Undibacterium sp. 20NA77.5]WMW79820.1 DNA-binding protein YbiB [Undibacterium sp. 20NA77.5]
MSNHLETFAAAKYIKQIGRGKEGARSLTRDEAQELYGAMLDQRVSELELGGILLAMRIKGESIDEIDGFLAAAKQRMTLLQKPISAKYAPVIIPTYNGARKRPNLTPLLAFLLAREGVPVLLHGVRTDPGRTASAEIWQALGCSLATSVAQANQQLAQDLVSFLPLDVLMPGMHALLEKRRILGLRSSTHTLVKVMQVFDCAALRLTSYTHPEYQVLLHDYYSQRLSGAQGAALLMRGTEGETVASTGRAQQISLYRADGTTVLQEQQASLEQEHPDLPSAIDAPTTALWIADVIRGERPVPVNIAQQVAYCKQVAASLL